MSTTNSKARYKIELNLEQAQLLICALDFYSRIGIAQFNHVQEVFLVNEHDRNRCYKSHALSKAHLNAAKFLMSGQPANGSYGIHSREVNDRFRNCWDMQQVIRFAIAQETHNDKNEWHTDYKPPSKSGTLPMIRMVRLHKRKPNA